MGIRHKFRSPIADDGIPSGEVKPSDWNDDHEADGYIGAAMSLPLAANSLAYVDADKNPQLALVTAIGLAILTGNTPADVLFYLGGAPAANAVLTGAPTAPTPDVGDNSTRIATMAAVQAAIANLVASSPAALDTLNELASALGNDPNFAATISTSLGYRVRFDAVQSLTAPQLAQVYSNMSLGSVVTYNVGTGAGAVPVLDGSGLLSSGVVPTGVGANQIVRLDAGAKLPAIDGSQLTGVIAGGAVLFNAPQALTVDQMTVARGNIRAIPFAFDGAMSESHSGGAMTFAVKAPSGGDPSVSVPVVFRFLDAAGSYSYVAATAALSITIPSGATIGHQSGLSHPVYLYAINNAGAVELAVSTKYFGGSGNTSTAAIAGGVSSGLMYSATARASVSFALLGVAYSTQTTAGTWSASPSSMEVGRVGLRQYAFRYDRNGVVGTTNGIAAGASTKATGFTAARYDDDGAFDGANSRFVCREPGIYCFVFSWGTNETVTGNISGQIYVNGAVRSSGPYTYSNGISPVCQIVGDVQLVAGDVVEFYCRNDVGAAKTLYGATSVTYVTGRMVRPGRC